MEDWKPKAGFLYNVCGVWGNTQSYSQAVPVMDNFESIWMIDTYHLDRPFTGRDLTDAAIERCIDYGEVPHQSVVSRARYDFYYHNVREITHETDMAPFEEVADLRDFRAMKYGEKESHYNAGDVLYRVRLFNEHGYDWCRGDIGVSLLRKGAVPNPENTFRELLADFKSSETLPDTGDLYPLRQLLSQAEEMRQNGLLTEEMRADLADVQAFDVKIQEIRDELSRFAKAQKAARGLSTGEEVSQFLC